MSGGLKKGMTLVELLVVLVILASVAVSVAVSSSGMLERTRVDRTTAQGEAMRDALEAHDGLSIVSDLGISYFRAIQTAITNTVDGTDTALLNLLFDYRHPREITVEVEGAEPAPDTIIKEVAPYQTLTFTNTYATLLSGIVTNSTLRTKMLDKWFGGTAAAPQLGGGWRGPYCAAKVLDSDRILRDAFGGAWRFSTNTASRSAFAFSLMSLGRDHAEGGTDWPDEDRLFGVRSPADTTLTVTGILPDGATAQSLHVFYFEPEVAFTANAVLEEDVQIRTVAKSAAALSCSLGDADINGEYAITPGARLLFAVAVDAESGDKAYVAPPRTVLVRPGANQLNLSLIEVN